LLQKIVTVYTVQCSWLKERDSEGRRSQLYFVYLFQTLVCSHPGSPRRCGGQGDLLSGALGTFLFWSSRSNQSPPSAAYSASLLARECAGMGFEKFGRSMVASDLIPLIHPALNRLMEH
jgi:ATP-dependent NAD(P)H-hydrate dehydratase